MVRSAATAVLCTLGVLAAPGELTAQEPSVTSDAAAEAAPVAVDRVVVRGNERLAEPVLRAEVGVRAGDTITYREIQDAIRRLWATGQFDDVKVYVEGQDSSEPVSLIVEVAERPVVQSVEIRGLEHVSAGTVEDTVGLETGRPLPPSKVAETKAMIRSLLGDKGIRLRDVTHRVEDVPGAAGEKRLVIDVDEGHRITLRGVEFRGNEAFTDAQLRDALDTQEEGFFWFQSGTYRQDALRGDLRESLPAFYGEHGYIDFAVTNDSLEVDPETGKARLIITVNEGPQYQLADFDVEGNRRFPTEDLKRYFEQERSGLLSGLGFGGGSAGATDGSVVFDQSAFEGATEQVNQLYRNQGYLYAQVEPVVERTETDAGEPAVRVAWQVREGEPAYVNRVKIKGNTFTHERVIRERVMLLPGDVYDEDALLQSYRRIAALGFFETPMPMPDINPTEDGDVNVTFNVKEKQTGSINFGTAIGGWGGISGFLGYDQPNLFGQAKSGHLRWEYGRWVNNFEASYSDPSVLGSRISGSASLFSTRGTGTRYYRLPGGEYRRTGASLRFGLPLPVDPYSRLSLGYSLAQNSYSTMNTQRSESIFDLPSSLLSTVSVGLVRNTLNHPLFPTQGTRHQVQAEFNGGPLGGDGNFQKYSLAGKWYVPVGQVGGNEPGSQPVRFTLGLSADAGVLTGNAARFPFERFWMGGVRFGESLRGYEETTVTPAGFVPSSGSGGGGVPLSDRFGNAYMRLSAEYAVRFNDNLSLSMFYDAGNIWDSPSDINPTRLLRGAGVGVTVVTPFGPLGLDYAYGFDKHQPGWKLHFKLSPGS